jgi:hypothetical protein
LRFACHSSVFVVDDNETLATCPHFGFVVKDNEIQNPGDGRKLLG